MALSKFLKRLEIMEELKKKNMMSLRNIVSFELFIAIFLMISMSSVREISSDFLRGYNRMHKPYSSKRRISFFSLQKFFSFLLQERKDIWNLCDSRGH